MNRKDAWLLSFCAAAALWALWPAWADPRLAPSNYGDLWAYHHPMRHAVAESLQRGRLPFWQPYIFSGLPLAANPQAVLFYPFSALGFVLPQAPALSWDMLLHLFWAMLGMGLLCRRARLPAAAAWTTALIYGLSPFLVYRIVEGIPTLLAGLAWIPWCWLALFSGGPAWLGAAWALQGLSGHAQFLVLNALAMAVWSALSPRRAELGRRLVLGGLWAAALTLAQALPTAEFAARSVRRSWPSQYALSYILDPAGLLSLLHPGVSGDPGRGTFAGPPSVFFETRPLWIGLVGLGAATAGLALKTSRAALVFWLAGGAAMALGAQAALGLPGLSVLRTQARWLLWPLWALVVAAAAGLARAGRRDGRLAAALLLLAAGELALWDGRFLGASRAADFLQPNARFAEAVGERPARLITDPELANPNKAALYHAANANGYEAFYLDGYPQYAARAEGKAAADSSRVYLSRLGAPELDRLGVRWKVGSTGLTVSDKAWPLAYFIDESGARVRPDPLLTRREPERWAVRGAWPPRAARLVAAQPAYPGWSAWLGGRPVSVEPWDGLLQSVRRPPEAVDGFPAKLDLRFKPTGWPLLVAIMALAWALWLRRLAEAA